MAKKKKTTKSTKKKPVIHVTSIYIVEENGSLWCKIKLLFCRIIRIFKRK